MDDQGQIAVAKLARPFLVCGVHGCELLEQEREVVDGEIGTDYAPDLLIADVRESFRPLR